MAPTVRPVQGDVESLLDAALAVAGGRDVAVDGGDLVRQALNAGRVDTITATFVPILLGEGIRLFEGLTDARKLQFVPSHPMAGGMWQVRARVLGAVHGLASREARGEMAGHQRLEHSHPLGHAIGGEEPRRLGEDPGLERAVAEVPLHCRELMRPVHELEAQRAEQLPEGAVVRSDGGEGAGLVRKRFVVHIRRLPACMDRALGRLGACGREEDGHGDGAVDVRLEVEAVRVVQLKARPMAVDDYLVGGQLIVDGLLPSKAVGTECAPKGGLGVLDV
jgi:hypothetical protein